MASIFNRPRERKVRDSVYSIVSSSELTPGSVDVWLDLPEEIRLDPALAPFQRLYQQRHGDFEPALATECDKNGIKNKITEETTRGEKDSTEESSIPHRESLGESGDDDAAANSGNRLIETKLTNEEKQKSDKTTQLMKGVRIFKLTALVGCWVFLTVSMVLYKEKTDIYLHTAVTNGDVKEYELHPPQPGGQVSAMVMLTGPLVESRENDSQLLHVWLHRAVTIEDQVFEQTSSSWIVYLQSEELLDFSPSVTVSSTISLKPGQVSSNSSEPDALLDSWSEEYNNATRVTLRMRTPVNATVPLTISYLLNPIGATDGIIYAAILLCILYVLIIFEIVNRTIAALLSSTLAVGVLALCGLRPSLPELVSWLDVETLLLLFSMMLLVAMLAETGLFDCLAVFAFEVTGGRTWPLITCLCLFTAVSSTFLDNVTTVLLVTPITIRLCEVMQLNPVPVLMSMVIFSNVGGAATPVGDPPNVIIASHPSLIHANINFTTFTLHMGAGVLLVGVQTYLQLRFMFRDINSLRHSVPAHILEMRQEIAAWRRAAASLTSYSKDEDIVKRALDKKVEKLGSTLRNREAGKGISKKDPKFCSTLAQMKQKYRIRDRELLIKSIISVSFVVLVFFLHAIPELQRLSLGWTAFLGAILLLLLAEREDLEPILARVEWSTLLFFAALFVFMEALSKLGLISWIGNIVESVILKVGEESRLAVALMLVLWVSGLASAFVDNIPLTTMMVRVTAALAHPAGLGLPLAPLAWALSLGACLGGNGTLIGASANVVCAGVAEQHGYKFTFMEYLKIGFPVMIGNLLVASIYLLFCHCVFEWH